MAFEPFYEELKTLAEDSYFKETDKVTAAKEVLKFVDANRGDCEKALSKFGRDGHLLEGAAWPASAYSDFYKWTMLPVMTLSEKARPEGVRCTFSANIRDAGYRQELLAAAKAAITTEPAEGSLFYTVKQTLQSLAERVFDRDTFEAAAIEYSLPGWSSDVLDSICGPVGAPRRLVDRVIIDPSCSTPATPNTPEEVVVQLFIANDSKLSEEKVYIEATGPWHLITWLETSMMQAIYEALFRDAKRKSYACEDAIWYPKWMAEAMVRCARGAKAGKDSGLAGALFTGRRTGGLALMMIQGLYMQQSGMTFLGTSSVTCRYWLKALGVTPALIPACAGTHAHELSMVLSSLLGELDDKVGMPLSQVVGHMLYFLVCRPQGDVREPGRKVLMPMLPDTLGTRAFLKTASKLKVPSGPHKGEPVLSVIGAARQDSGPLDAFKDLMAEFQFQGSMMASEIEVAEDLFTAKANGFKLFGAGGFMGDSEKAWDKSKRNISMAIKVLRVYVGDKLSPYAPVKTGDPSRSGEGKFEADGTIDAAGIAAVKARVEKLSAAEPLVSDEELQQLFEATVLEFTSKLETRSMCCVA